MPFLLYEYHSDPKGFTTYQLIRNVKLAGRSGPIATFVCGGERPKTPVWHLPESKLLREVGGEPERHALLVDLKPNVKKNVSLYRLREIWGYSASEWTPILLRLDRLFSDEKSNDPEEFKRRFDDGKSEIITVYEFLYLQGETSRDSWAWGKVGSVNGALLFPAALDYFLSVLSEGRAKAAGTS
jgi:hypothetical protein